MADVPLSTLDGMRNTGPDLRRWALAGLVGLLGGAVAALGTGGSAGADEPLAARGVVAKASAQGARAVYTIPDYVVVSQIFDGGGPVTQAEADSTGRATSFAALPYPGENAIAAPGVLSVAFGRSVPLAYPFYVEADHPSVPAAELGEPTGSYKLVATAGDGATTATGSLQGPPAGAAGVRSSSSALLDDGGVVRTVAESVATGISLGDGALRIASVTTRSETVLGPDDQEPVTTTSLVIEGASVAGHAVTIDADGVHGEDRSVAAPVGQGFGTDNQFLGQLGLSVRVVPTGLPGGADALVITSRQTFPAPGNPKGTLIMTFGGAASEITVGSPDGPALDTPVADSGPAQRTAETPAAVREDASSSPSLATNRSDDAPVNISLPSSAVVVEAPPAAGSVPLPENGSAPPARAGLAVQGAARRVVQPDLGTTGALYSLLGLGGIGLVGVTRLLRWRGGRV